MHARTIAPRTTDASGLTGLIVTQEVRHAGKRLFHKGDRITADQLPALAELDVPIHAVRLEEGDVHEDDAARRLAALAMGPGIVTRGPVQSRINLVAGRKGLLRIDAEAVFAINTLDGPAIFTLPDRLPVLPGKVLAGVKITPVAVPESTLAEAETYARGRPQPIVQVKPFLPLTVGVVTTEQMAEKARERFQHAVRTKMGWFGGDILRFEEVAADPAAIAATIRAQIADGARLILAGGSNTIDPLDPTLLALPEIDATIVRFGAPVHPGSMFWLAYTSPENVPVFNLSSCSMYSKATVADLVLPWIMAGEPVTLDDIASIGYGGLLERDMGWRFPAYDAASVDEPDD
jgi:hypothetical protein